MPISRSYLIYTFTTNRLNPEQRCQTLQIYYQNQNSAAQRIAWDVSKIASTYSPSRAGDSSSEGWLSDHAFTLIMRILRNDIRCAPKMLLLLRNRLTKKTPTSCVHSLYGRFCGFVERSWFACIQNSNSSVSHVRRIGPKRDDYLSRFSQAKFSAKMRPTFGSIGTLLNKIVSFGVMVIPKSLLRRLPIVKMSQFVVLY